MNPHDTRLCLLVSRQCNTRCSFCPVDFTGGNMSLDIARQAVDQYIKHLPSSIFPRIKFFGGEPLLNWTVIYTLVEDYLNKGVSFQISTNGILLDKEKIAYLKKRPEVEVTLSFRAKGGAELPDSWFTMVLTQGQSPEEIISRMRILLQDGYRQFNFLPAYFSLWTAGEIKELKRVFQSLQELFFRLWDKRLECRIKNTEVLSPIPLYNAALTVDVDGGVYSSSLIETREIGNYRSFLKIGSITRWPSLREPRCDGRILHEIVRRWAGPKLWASTEAVDGLLSCFVKDVSKYKSFNTFNTVERRCLS
jgi:hypothetical protein